MACKMCNERGLAVGGTRTECAFTGERFSPDNWNCATANAIRDIVEASEPREGVHVEWGQDQHYATLSVSEIEHEDADAEGAWLGGALWVGWYKRRGRTEALWIVTAETEPRRPTEAECLRIIAHYDRDGHIGDVRI